MTDIWVLKKSIFEIPPQDSGVPKEVYLESPLKYIFNQKYFDIKSKTLFAGTKLC